jgi:N6-adenosine-specific RNA methylase IME4
VPDGYRCIVADPPWAEYGGGGRGAQNHYALLSVPDIARVMLRSPSWRPADDAHLWLWTTDNYLPGALYVMQTLGFRYVRTFCWVKVKDTAGPFRRRPRHFVDLAMGMRQIGVGQYARGSHELCLFGVRGASSLPESAPSSVLFATRQEHSRKPAACFTEWFERVSPGPRLEMFSREPRAGWDAWGNDTQKFTASQAG